MFARSPFTLALLTLATSLMPAVLGCHPPRSINDTGDYPIADWGGDEPSDPATTGYFINHLSLNVRNMSQSLEFYTGVFGMRRMFTVEVSEHLSISYMAHSQGGRNGTGYQTAAELNRDKNNLAGLLELISLDVEEPSEPTTTTTTTTHKKDSLSHIGIIVPDMEKTQARLEAFGVTVYKRTGDDWSRDALLGLGEQYLGSISKLSEEEIDTILPIWNQMNKDMIFAADPDGNLIEIQPLSGAPIIVE